MKLRLTAAAMAISALAMGPAFADGAGGDCAYGSKYRYTEAEPQEQTEASRKLASLKLSTGDQETTAETAESAPSKTPSSTTQAADQSTAQ